MEEEKPKVKKAAETEGEKEHKPNWRETHATVEEIKAYLADRIYFRHNVVTKRTECRLPSERGFFFASYLLYIGRNNYLCSEES